MKIIFLGTNGWYDTVTGNTLCTLIDFKDGYIILDAGNGFYKIGDYIKEPKPIYLFLSHFHLDHLCGLHITDKFFFKQGIDCFGPPGIKMILSKLINSPFSLPLKKLKTQMRLHNLTKARKPAFLLEFRKLKHVSFCYGYRFAIERKIVAYCTDTGLCRNLFLLARDADLLITESSYAPGEKNLHWPHLNPQQAAYVAKKAKVKKLVLTHFDAARYQNLSKRKKAEESARKYFTSTTAALEDMKLVL